MNEHLRIWRYRVEPDRRKEFLHHYSSEGTWTQLFQRADGYLGTTLWQDADDENVFYTQDRWRSESDFAHFQAHYANVYEELDRQFEGMTTEETLLAACNAVEA